MRLKLQQKTQTPQKVQLISLEYLLTGAKKMGKKNIRRIVFLFTIESVKLLVRFFLETKTRSDNSATSLTAKKF